jgi:ADP-ribosylglycohydrolase
MIGAIIGDVVGSVYEWHNVKTTDFPLFSRFTRFTDDTVLTVAVANATLLKGSGDSRWSFINADKRRYAEQIKIYAKRYPDAGYGGRFEEWVKSGSYRPYHSYGNGSAMRVSPVAYAFDTLDEVLVEAKKSAAVTHNHREGIKGAQAVAGAVFLARMGRSKEEIKEWVESACKYNVSQRLDDIRPNYQFDSSCQGSVPQAIIAFLESEHFEDAIRKAISLGGDSDTIASISGAIAEAFYKEIPKDLWNNVRLKLDPSFFSVIHTFQERYMDYRRGEGC